MRTLKIAASFIIVPLNRPTSKHYRTRHISLSAPHLSQRCNTRLSRRPDKFVKPHKHRTAHIVYAYTGATGTFVTRVRASLKLCVYTSAVCVGISLSYRAISIAETSIPDWLVDKGVQQLLPTVEQVRARLCISSNIIRTRALFRVLTFSLCQSPFVKANLINSP